MVDRRFDGDPELWAAKFDDPARDEWQMPDRVIAKLALLPGQRVADVGAGTGYFAMKLAKAQPQATVYAVDIEPSMVAYLGKRAAAEGATNVIAVHGLSGAPNLPQPVDLVLMVDTFHHVADRVAYFRELRRVLRKGGRVAIIDHRRDAVNKASAHMRLTPEQIVNEMGQAGYRLAARHEMLPRQHFLEFRPSR
jgi:ubiquinone/menaquinone biosynthesis C-methylase UbiE